MRPPDNDIGVEILAVIDVALHEGLECVPPDNGVGVEILADVDVALQEDWNAMPPGTTLE